jgi:heavy metal sensor kinase
MVTAALVVATVLAIVLASVWSGLRSVELQRLDSRLCLEARRLASQPHGPEQLALLEADVAAKLRLAEAASLRLRVVTEGRVDLESAQWPAAIAIDRLPWSRSTASFGSECLLASVDGASPRWRVAVVSMQHQGIVAADPAAATEELLAAARGTLSFVVALAVVLVALGAWLLSAISLRPVVRLRDAMKAVSRKDLSRRLTAEGEDREFRELIGAYNDMLERLQASFEQASRFSADAAHELRTPLTILQGRLEQAIRKYGDPGLQADLAEMQEEIGRLASITRKLLLLSRSDAGQLALHRTPVDLGALLDGLAGDARMLASDQRVTAAIEPELAVLADEDLLRQLLNNVVSNALRYCRPGGDIAVEARRVGRDVEVTFANACVPIASEARRRLFDRFFRLDPARGRTSEGTGLGLSLAREIARAHGGDLTLDETAEEVFRLRLRLPSA